MALDFNVLTQVPSFGERFAAGQEAGRAAAAQNMLLQQRQMEFQQSQEDRRLAAEERQRKAAQLEADRGRRQTFLVGLQQQMAQNGYRLDRKTLADVLTEGLQTGEDNLVQIGTKGLQALDDEDAWQAAFGGGAAPAGAAPAAMPAPAAPQLGAPLTDVEDVSRANALGRTDPRFAMAMPVNEYPAEPPAPVANAMAAPPADTERQRLNALLNNRNKAIRDEARERLKAMDAAKPRPLVVAGRLVSPEGQVLFEPSPTAMTPAERFVPVGPNVFNRETGQYVPAPARELAPRQAPEGRVKPAAPMRLRPGEILVSPETGQPIFTAPPAPAPAGRAAAAPGAPAAVGTPAQQAAAARRQTAQANLSQDIRTQLGYYEQLAKMGGMTSPERSVAENVTAFARSSGLGQTAERAIGTQAQTLRDNIKNTRQRLFMSIKDATGATAGQMNSNMEMQAWLDAMTNPQQSIETVRETLKQLDSVIAGMREQVAREAAAKGGANAAPAAAPSRSTGVDIQTERANAQAAIAAGAPEAAVRQRFKDKTGQEL